LDNINFEHIVIIIREGDMVMCLVGRQSISVAFSVENRCRVVE